MLGLLQRSPGRLPFFFLILNITLPSRRQPPYAPRPHPGVPQPLPSPLVVPGSQHLVCRPSARVRGVGHRGFAGASSESAQRTWGGSSHSAARGLGWPGYGWRSWGAALGTAEGLTSAPEYPLPDAGRTGCRGPGGHRRLRGGRGAGETPSTARLAAGLSSDASDCKQNLARRSFRLGLWKSVRSLDRLSRIPSNWLFASFATGVWPLGAGCAGPQGVGDVVNTSPLEISPS